MPVLDEEAEVTIRSDTPTDFSSMTIDCVDEEDGSNRRSREEATDRRQNDHVKVHRYFQEEKWKDLVMCVFIFDRKDSLPCHQR